MKNRYSISLLLTSFLLLLISNACTTPDPPESDIITTCIDTNCADYNTWEEAQAAFDTDPECRKDLDHDSDRIACEHLMDEISNCPTTANCGCSGKSKAQCQQDPCCRWIVGEGCRCN